jgi:predicted esterase
MKNLLLGLCLVACIPASAQNVAKGLTASNGVYIGFYEYKPVDYNPSEKYPVIVFLHGIGERGNGTTQLSTVLNNGTPRFINEGHPMRFYWNGRWQTFLVLTPQLSPNYGWWQEFYVDEMIAYAKANLSVDTNRIFLAGLSLGGGGTWRYAASALANAKKLAGIAVCCGTCEALDFCNIANAKLPTWAFHATDDGVIPANCTNGTIQAIDNCNPAVKPYKTIWTTGNHGIWNRVYDPGYASQHPNIYEWMLGQDKSLPVNSRPVANAGANVTISTSPGSVTLSAAHTTDADGVIRRYVWSKISGPSFGTINTPVSADGRTVISNLLVPGTYVWEVRAIDDRGDWTTDQVTITVVSGAAPNIPPVTEAGQDQETITSTASLNGANTYDPDGSIANYQWTKIAGPAAFTISDASAAAPALTDLVIGTYQFELESTDNMGATTKDTVTINSTATLLPVKWLYFRGKNSGHTNLLTWAIENEMGNDHFEVEKSTDGQSYMTIGSVQGRALSLLTKEYSFADAQVTAGTAWYRLKQVGKDGKISYSTIVSVEGHKPVSIGYFPNPVRTRVTIAVNDKSIGMVRMRLYSLDGRLVQQQQLLKQQEYVITDMDMKKLNSGVYLLEVTIDDKLREVRKIIKN